MQSEFGEKRKRFKSSDSISKKSSIARSFENDDDTYSLHRTGVNACSNKLECVAFGHREILRGDRPLKRDPVQFF